MDVCAIKGFYRFDTENIQIKPLHKDDKVFETRKAHTYKKTLDDLEPQVLHVIFLIKRSQNMRLKVSQADRDRQPAFLIDQAHRDLIAAV
jgi:hypothetical protein